MLAYLGWITAAFGGGFLLACWICKRRSSVQLNFSRIETFRGRSFREIVAIAGVRPDVVIRQQPEPTLKIWKRSNYCLILYFNDNDICLGVKDEQF